MKKLLASLLSMAMALSLALPAFAADTPLTGSGPGEEPPSGWTADVERAELAKELGIPTAEDYELSDDTWEWIIAHPEETKEYLSSGIAALLQRMGYASIEDFCKGWISPEGATLNLLENWVWGQYDPAEDLTPPLWQTWGYSSYEAMLEANGYTPRAYGSIVSYAAQFMETRPEETAQLRSNAYDYFAQEYPDDTPQKYMARWGQSEEDFLVEMTVWQILDVRAAEARQAELAEFEAAHPGMTARFEANAYTYFAQEHPWWDSAEEYMELYDLTEREFIDQMVDEQIADQNYKDEMRAFYDQMKAELGGVPGQIGVMIDGEYVKFSDAAPEITNGRTMVPLRTIMEVLGAEVTYNGSDDIRCTVDGVEYTFAVGSTGVKLRYVQWDGEGDAPDMEGLEMDCAPYIKNSRTYVPVRFFAEALGYTVGWDSDFKTAVLMDTEKLAAEIDKSFTILNRARTAQLVQPGEGQSLQSELSGEAVFTAFDTLNGNTEYRAAFSGEALQNATAASGSASLTLSDNAVDALMALLVGLSELPEEEAALLRAALKEMELSFILNAGENKAWLRTSLMSLLGTGGADAWYALDMSDMNLGELSGMFAAQYGTVGQAVAAGLDPNSVMSWSLGLEGAEQTAELLGDSRFVKQNGVDTLVIGPEALGMDEEDSAAFQEFNLTLTVDGKGKSTTSMVIHTANQGMGSVSMRLTMDSVSDTGKSTLTAELHIANVGKLELSLTAAQQPSSQWPMTQPPAGDTVVESLVTP